MISNIPILGIFGENIIKKFLYAAVIIFGTYGPSEAMIEDSPQISYRSAAGEFVKRRLADVDERTFQDMSPGSF